MGLVLIFGATATSPATAVEPPALPTCENVRHAVVTDVDETLTTADSELWKQVLVNPAYNPLERPDASEMLAAYAAKGYWIVYVTARPEQLQLRDGRTERKATNDWLDAIGSPRTGDRSMTFLAPDVFSGLLPRGYKGEVVKSLQASGFSVDYAYGNASTDFQAYADAGLPLERTFSIGELAGYDGTTAIAGDGYSDHLASHLPAVQAVCDPEATPPGPDASCPLVSYDGIIPWLLNRILHIPVQAHDLACH